MAKICNINFWIENDPPPPLELFRKFIHFGRERRPLVFFVCRLTIIISQVENFSGLLLYGLNFGMLKGKAVISLKQTISFDFCLLDYDFEPSSESLHVLLKVDSSVMVETYKMDCSKLVKDSTHSFNDLKQADFFDSVKDFEKSNLENLHKRWFDNVKDYMEKKESRQEQMKRKDPPPTKKLKPEN